MSDRLEEAAGHAAPSGGAIVDHTKDGARQGRGRPGVDGQTSGGRWLPARTGLAQLSCRDPGFRAEIGSSSPEAPGVPPSPRIFGQHALNSPGSQLIYCSAKM